MRFIFLLLPALALSLGLRLSGPAAAQQTAETDPPVRLETLLSDGYDIKAMDYLQTGMLFTMQRGPTAFVCETTLNGESKVCLPLK